MVEDKLINLVKHFLARNSILFGVESIHYVINSSSYSEYYINRKNLIMVL